MRTETIKIYSFEELNEDAKKKAIEKHYDINVDDDWWQFGVYEDAENIGVKITEFDLDRANYCNIDLNGQHETVAHSIVENHSEKCDTYICAKEYLKERGDAINMAPKDSDGNFEDENELDYDLDELDEQFTKDLSECYLSILKKEYEWRLEEKQVIETIISNEYEFTETGERY